MVNIVERCRSGDLDAEVAIVIASRPCAGVGRAHRLGVPVEIEPGGIGPERLAALAESHRFAWVALAGYLKMLEIPESLAGRVVNIHPALLPGDGSPGPFGGPGMYGHRVHEALIDAARQPGGPTESGCTVHFCDDRYDAGEVILQRRCPILEADTPDSLAARVFELELGAYPDALRIVLDRET